MNKRIIICGKAAAGKNILKQRFIERGFKPEISYTTRPKRKGETEGIDYHYISEKDFRNMIAKESFYEWAEHGDYKYGTGKYEWDNCDIFIMETHGISEITPEDRKNCFIIYLDIFEEERIKRLRDERKWTDENINHRINMDNEKFSIFKDYDLLITNPYF